MMRWILVICVVIIICLDVPKIDAMKCFLAGKSKKQDNNNSRVNTRNLQSNTSSSQPTPSNGLQPFQGNLRPPITSGVPPSTSGLQSFERSPQPTIPSSSQPSISGSHSQPRNTKSSPIRSVPPHNTGSKKSTPNPDTVKRLSKELRDFAKDPSQNCSAGLKNEEDLFEWIATINGPEKSPYEGGVFKLSLSMPKNYPHRPPEVTFLTKVYHCNIGSNSGSICLDILGSGWRPSMTVSSILLYITSFLIKPNCDSPINGSIAEIYKKNKRKYYKNARQWTEKYAKPQ